MPKASTKEAVELAKASVDCGFLVSHLIRQQDGRTNIEARKILLSILGMLDGGQPRLVSSSTGWYSSVDAYSFDPAKGDFKALGATKSVCFTEATLHGLLAHKAVFGAKYGIAFDRDWLFLRGANPCLNIRTDLLKKKVKEGGKGQFAYNYVPEPLRPSCYPILFRFESSDRVSEPGTSHARCGRGSSLTFGKNKFHGT